MDKNLTNYFEVCAKDNQLLKARSEKLWQHVSQFKMNYIKFSNLISHHD